MNQINIADRRAILLSARMRFSPHTQPVREMAIDKIIEQNLLVADCERGVTIRDIESQEALCLVGGPPSIIRVDMEKSLKRLVESKRVDVKNDGGKERYRLAEEARKELWEMQRTSEARFTRVLAKLFGDSDDDSSKYRAPFLECLCTIFAKLGEIYVRQIKGDIGEEELIRMPSVKAALLQMKQKYKSIDPDVLETGVISFFQEIHPDYVPIKWNMAQNYYIAKALGLDRSGYLLSKEVFGDAVLYLDTNIVIDALEPEAHHHGSFKALSTACHQLQTSFNVCQISLNELRHVVENQKEMIKKTEEQIPDETADKVGGIFYQLYRQQLSITGSVDLDKVFSNFDNPRDDLASMYDVETIDHAWFDLAPSLQRVKKRAEELRVRCKQKRGHLKAKTASLHDAILLDWIQGEKEKTGKKTWLVTLDTTLPGFRPEGSDDSVRTTAITLDALLQWISPIAVHGEFADQVADIFSEAVKYQLLPQEYFFDLRDFIVFADMQCSCKELPAKDVETCIRYIRSTVPDLDPFDATDREKISYKISKFFADPSREYVQELERLEIEKVELETDHRTKVGGLETKIQELEKRGVKQSAFTRLGIVLLIFLVLEYLALYIGSHYGAGSNSLQRIKDLWFIPTIAFFTSIGLSWFIIGRERIRTLGWPFTKLLKDEESKTANSGS